MDTGGELVFTEGGNYMYFYDGTYPGASILTTYSGGTRQLFLLANPKQTSGENANAYIGVSKGGITSTTEFTGIFSHLDYDTASNDNLQITVGGTDVFYLNQTGAAFMGDTANTGMTVGLTINQGANDDEAFALKSSDIAVGMTDLAETDSFGVMKKHAGATGGLRIQGFSEDAVGVALYGHYTNDDTTRATTSNGGVMIRASKKSGTMETTPSANANLLVVKSAGSTRFLVDQEGDIHMDATSNINAWDDHDDIQLLAGVREAMNPGVRLAEFVETARPVLERTGVVTYNPDGHHFISLKNLHALEIDAMRQLHQRIQLLEDRLARLDVK